jgi:hypothetical protein
MHLLNDITFQNSLGQYHTKQVMHPGRNFSTQLQRHSTRQTMQSHTRVQNTIGTIWMRNRPLLNFVWSQSYDRKLQRQRCKNLQRQEKPPSEL